MWRKARNRECVTLMVLYLGGATGLANAHWTPTPYIVIKEEVPGELFTLHSVK